MSYLHPDGRGRFDPKDLVIWRDANGNKPGLGLDQRHLLEISVQEMNCTLDAPWELILKEKTKAGRNAIYGKWYFDLEQEIWLTDRLSVPSTENGSPTNTRVLFSGKVKARSTEKGPDGDYYVYRVMDRRALMRSIPVTLSGPEIADPFETQGPNRLVYNAPPNDADLSFDRLGGGRADLETILNDYFDLFAPALSAVCGLPPNITFDIEGFQADQLVPGKIVIEDADFEQGLTQILSTFPYIRWYVTPGFFDPKVVLVSPLRLPHTHIIDYPDFDSPAADDPIATSWEANTEGVYTAVKIVAKTGRIVNNWTRMVSGFGSKVENTSSGASVVPAQAPDQPGKTIGVKVNTGDSEYYERWADAIRLNNWGGLRYWPYSQLPDGGGGTKRPIYALAMWEQRFEQDLRGGDGVWTGYRQPEILAGHYYGSRKTASDTTLTMDAVAFAAVPALITGTVNMAADDNYIYRLTDTERFWYTASLSGSAEPGGGVGAVTIRRRRGPWAGGRLVIPPQPGDARPSGMRDPDRRNSPIVLDIQITNGSDVWATIIPELRPYVGNHNWGGPSPVALWHYQVHEPGNKLRGPDNQFRTIGGRWSGMFQNYRLFDPEMVWRWVDSQGGAIYGADSPRFAAFASEVCFVGIWTKTKDELSSGHTGPIPDPENDPTDAWKRVSTTIFFPLFPKLGGHPDYNSALVSVGPSRAFESTEDPPGSGTFTIRPVPFDIQFGWYEQGGGVTARYPDTGFDGEGAAAPYNIRREKVIGVDLTEYIDVEETTVDQGNLGTRLETIAEQYWRTLNKIPRLGQITLNGLDFDLCTVLKEGPLVLKPFTYYIAQDIDQADLKPPPSGAAADASAAATVGIRYDMEAGTTTIDLTEDRSGLQRDLIAELTSELRSRQLVFDIRNTVQGFKAFIHCIGTGETSGGAGSSISNGPTDLCSFQLKHPERAEDYISLCALLGIMWVRGGKKPPPQEKGVILQIPINDGVTTTGGMMEFEADPDVNPLTRRFDEYPNHPLFGPLLSSTDFTRRGSQFFWDSKMQAIVGEFYGNKSRYRLLGGSLDPTDNATLIRDTTITPTLAGWGTGPVLAYLYDFLGWTPQFALKIAEAEDGAPVPFSIAAQPINLLNASFASWAYYEPEEIPGDCALYLNFEEASGSLYDKGPSKHVLAVGGTPTFGATGIVTGELGITYINGSSSHSIADVPNYDRLKIGYLPFAVRLRFKLNTTGVTQTLVDNSSGSPLNGVRIRITTGNVLEFTVGDGVDTSTVTHTTVMSSGNWYSFVCAFNHIDQTVTISSGTQDVAGSPHLVGFVNNVGKAFTVSGTVTWDELEVIVGNHAAHTFQRCLLPTSWQTRRTVTSNYDFSPLAIDTADANGGVAAVVVSANAASSQASPIFLYQDTDRVPDLVLIPGHTYRLKIKCKTGSGSPTIAPWVENLDQRTLLTTASAFTESDTALTLTTSALAWTTNTITFTVPETYNAWDRWRIGVRVASGSGTVTAKFGGAPAFSLEEIDAALTGTEYALVDSDGMRVGALDSDGRVAAV